MIGSYRQIQTLILGGVISLTPLAAQTLTWGNVTDTTINPDMVLGDSWTLNISGATAGASIVLQYTQDGSSPQNFTEGTVLMDGTFTSTQPVNSLVSLGTWTNKWFIGGVQAGIEYDYEVIDKPQGLTVQAAGLASPNCSLDGILIDVNYKITGTSGVQVKMPNLDLLLEPYEDGQVFNEDGSNGPTYSNNVGPKTGYATSGQYAKTDGNDQAFFHDVPLGVCWPFTYSTWHWANQDLSMKVVSASSGAEGTKYPVLSQSWTSTGTGAGTGSTDNNLLTVSVSN